MLELFYVRCSGCGSSCGCRGVSGGSDYVGDGLVYGGQSGGCFGIVLNGYVGFFRFGLVMVFFESEVSLFCNVGFNGVVDCLGQVWYYVVVVVDGVVFMYISDSYFYSEGCLVILVVGGWCLIRIIVVVFD